MKELLNTGVSIGLEYCPEIDGLIGRIKDFSVAVRENNETGSYGVLLWAKKGEYNPITSVNDYLADRVNSDSDTVKNFRVQERGIAVALKKTDDPFKNANTIKRFLIDLTGILSVNFYKSCCHKCGKTENLGIYLDNGVPSQYCSACSAGKTLLKDFPETKIAEALSFEALMPKEEAIAEAESVLSETKNEEAPIIHEKTEEIEIPEANETEDVAEEMPEVELLPVGANSEENEEAEADEAEEEVEEMPEVELLPVGANSEENEEVEANEAEEEAEEMPEVELLSVGANSEENEEVEADEAEEEVEEMPEVELLPVEANSEENEEAEADEAEEEAEEMPEVEIPSSDNNEDIGDLLTETKTDYDGSYDNEVKKEEIPDNTDISALMMGAAEEKAAEYIPPKSELFEKIEREYLEEQKNAPKTEEKNDFSDFMVTPLDNMGTKEDFVTVTEANEGPIGHNDKIAVTELRDDSNDGEDIDVTEIESTISKPTDTSGPEQLTALETPLDENGNVPLMNPNAESDDNRPSPVNGPDAVLPSVSNKPMPKQEENTGVTPPGYAKMEDDPRAEAPDTQRLPEPPRPYDAPAYVAPINWGIPDSNPVMGIIGALAFAVLGVLVWSLIGRVGYISYVGSIALVASVFGGYRLAGGSIDTKGKVICTILSLLLTFVSFWVVLVLNVQDQIHSVFGFNISFFNAIEWAVKSYSNNNFVIFDLVLSMVFTVVAVVFTNKKIVQ